MFEERRQKENVVLLAKENVNSEEISIQEGKLYICHLIDGIYFIKDDNGKGIRMSEEVEEGTRWHHNNYFLLLDHYGLLGIGE
ncbi:hypothetical protein [Priestia aryabhattai]|uniref:hypothetical protein n=1 Tax=Priestia aryabhattai TaxID=412384 RepID=UPI0015F67623|nr:hypothetical protein [Priestia aryabhattai]